MNQVIISILLIGCAVFGIWVYIMHIGRGHLLADIEKKALVISQLKEKNKELYIQIKTLDDRINKKKVEIEKIKAIAEAVKDESMQTNIDDLINNLNSTFGRG